MSESLVLEQNQTTTESNTESKGIKLTIDRNSLLTVLGHVQSVVEKRSAIPNLSHVKIEAKENVLRLTATDMDIAIVDEIDATIKTSGALTVQAQTLYDIVRKLPDGAEISLEGDSASGGKLKIHSGGCNFVLSCLDADEFPAVDKGELPFSFDIPASDLQILISKPRYAVSNEETRYYLNGIYFHKVTENGKELLRSVATDGHRLAMVDVPLKEEIADIPGIIIPKKAVNELKKLLEQPIENITVNLSQNKISFVCGKAVLFSKLIDGTFPDYKKVIPSNNDKVIEISLDYIASAVDRVSVISQDKIRGVKLLFSEGKLVIAASSLEFGTATEELDINYSGTKIEIGFNARYLMEMFQQINGEVISISLANGVAPAVVRDLSAASELYVVMPMRV
jgi:DNA polymerase-3 subunit beta